eukprot:TRINITY_DN12946_c0_g3_i1.p1 TRINITY_DN12946_c0_g3~~TRINITY_DN12946_c0_g3_i1.p1  ORF type:complete len:552 (-),score=19.87 TRINITY_DN12946_c0_g3_i1:212-1867(-)
MQNGDIWQRSCKFKDVFSQIVGKMGQFFSLEKESSHGSGRVGLICFFLLSGIIGWFSRVKVVASFISRVVCVFVYVLGFLIFLMADIILRQEKKLSQQNRLFSSVFSFVLTVIKFWERMMINVVLLMVPKAGLLYINGKSILHAAVFNGHTNMVDTLVNGYFSNYKRNTALDKKIFADFQKRIVDEWLDASHRVDEKEQLARSVSIRSTRHIREHYDRFGHTSLHLAVDSNRLECVELLLQGSLPEYREMRKKDDNNTALHIAANEGNPKCVQVLLSNSKHSYRERVNGMRHTALHMAVFSNRPDCVELLLQDSMPEYREMGDKNKYTALHFASWYRDRIDPSNSKSCLELLLQYSRPEYREIQNSDGNTALHIAADTGHRQCIQKLLEDARPTYREMQNLEGQTALHMVCSRRSLTIKCMGPLLENSRAEYREIQNTSGYTSLHRACACENMLAVLLLLENARPSYIQIKNYCDQKAVQCIRRDHTIAETLLKMKYMRITLSLSANTLYVVNDNDMFWCADSIVKDTLPWLIGFESYDLPPIHMDPHYIN